LCYFDCELFVIGCGEFLYLHPFQVIQCQLMENRNFYVFLRSN
jgi:hypothetical protein